MQDRNTSDQVMIPQTANLTMATIQADPTSDRNPRSNNTTAELKMISTGPLEV